MRSLYERPENCVLCGKLFEDNEGLPLTNYWIWTCTYQCYLEYIRECNRRAAKDRETPWDY